MWDDHWDPDARTTMENSREGKREGGDYMKRDQRLYDNFKKRRRYVEVGGTDEAALGGARRGREKEKEGENMGNSSVLYGMCSNYVECVRGGGSHGESYIWVNQAVMVYVMRYAASHYGLPAVSQLNHEPYLHYIHDSGGEVGVSSFQGLQLASLW